MSCTPTEPVEKHDDISVLQDFINNSSGTLLASLDTDSSDVIEPLELGEQTWNDNGRIIILNCDSIGLSGRIPESIGDLTELTQLGLKNNNLIGEIPESIGNLTQLTQLSFSKNSLSGTIPDTIGNLKSLWRLDFSNNLLSGTLPRSLSNLSILEVLLADSNNLRSPIPQEICNIYNPNSNFEFSGNQFCPPLPYCIDSPNLIGYQNCDTSCGSGNTYLNGYCYSQSDLDVLQNLINNAGSLNMIMDTDTLEGVQPLELGFQEWQSGRLKTLDCYWDTVSCNLSTEFPVNIINLDSLKYLDFQHNALTGTIPNEISNLFALEDLYLQDNNLSGYLPESLCINDTTVWTNINLKNNQFCPCYPECINKVYSNFVSDQDISDCSYCIDGYTQICDKHPDSISFLEGDSLCFNTDNLAVLDAFIDSSLTTLPDSLDISMLADSTDIIQDIEPLELGEQTWANGKLLIFKAINRGLSGSIPPNIGSLDSLFILHISDNHLTGELPSGIFTLTNLYSLHLSGNQLSGEIPPSICDLTINNWEIDGFNPNRSYLDNNKFCQGETGYPDCISDFVSEQDTSNCFQAESP